MLELVKGQKKSSKNSSESSTKLRQEEFMSNIVHELRTPIHSILGYTKFCLKKLGVLEKDEIAKIIETIHKNSDRMLLLVNDLLDSSKIESEHFKLLTEENDLEHAINNIIREIQSLVLDKDIRLIMINKATNSKAEFDQFRIEQVVSNLLSNAIRFTPAGKKIGISLENYHLDDEEALLVKVSDNGPGLEPNELKTIFDKYVQTKKMMKTNEGTGLGLYIAQKIVKAHNGQIWAENNKNGDGLTFSFAIPKTQNPQTQIL